MKLTKNSDPDKYKYSGYGIGFDAHSLFLGSDGSQDKTVAIFDADMSSSVHFDNKKKDILVQPKLNTLFKSMFICCLIIHKPKFNSIHAMKTLESKL